MGVVGIRAVGAFVVALLGLVALAIVLGLLLRDGSPGDSVSAVADPDVGRPESFPSSTDAEPTPTEPGATEPTAIEPEATVPTATEATASTPAPGALPVVRFAAGGDLGATAETTATLRRIAEAGPDFFLALGDLSYGDLVPESAWCDYVTTTIGAEIPVELVVGNHEDDDRVDGWIGDFATCLPDRMAAVGVYPAEYHFDVDGLIRIIAIGAGNDVDGVKYDYDESERSEWLIATIEDARARAIPWVVVVMHKPCLSIGNKDCEIGQDTLDLLIDNEVDLVLQGHDHTYQRSKQLACATANVYDAGCVADDGSDGRYSQGAGTVFVVSGVTGGGGLTAVDLDDPEAQYLAAWMGGNLPTASRGFLEVTVTGTELEGRFVASDGDFADRFTIGR